eukprot:COSAG02_NODE_19200_length_895_cov_0.795226_2_plen_245_part_01
MRQVSEKFCGLPVQSDSSSRSAASRDAVERQAGSGSTARSRPGEESSGCSTAISVSSACTVPTLLFPLKPPVSLRFLAPWGKLSLPLVALDDAREGGRQGAAGGNFFSFDDTRVEEYDLRSNMENDCFGGKAFHSQWDPNKRQNVNREYSRVNSAYMLMYERDWIGDAEAEHEDDKQTRIEAAAKRAEEAAAKPTVSEDMDAEAAGSANAGTAAASSEGSSNAANVATAEGATIVGPDVLSAEVT